MTAAPFDIQKANRWFAIEFNNKAWDLVESASRTAADTEQMIHAAHAACVHWLAVGTPINHLRAQCLLATAYAAAGFGEAAVRHADRCLEALREAANEATPFDKATALGCASIAYACYGNMDQGRRFYDEALLVAQTLDEDDRPVFDKFYPKPA